MIEEGEGEERESVAISRPVIGKEYDFSVLYFCHFLSPLTLIT